MKRGPFIFFALLVALLFGSVPEANALCIAATQWARVLPFPIFNPPPSPFASEGKFSILIRPLCQTLRCDPNVFTNKVVRFNLPSGTRYTAFLNYAYDAVGNVTGIQSSEANGVNVTYGYDELGRLGTVHDAAVGTTGYGYDGLGNLQSCAYPNGVYSEYQYDSLNRLTNLASGQLGTTIANYAYTVGAAGNRLTANEQLFASTINSQPKTINRVYTYDDIYRLTGENISVNGVTNTGVAGYGYDPVGNRLSRSGNLLSSQSFAFDANDRLNSDSYDNNGNTLFGTGFAQSQPDKYDFENRLVQRTTTINNQPSTITIRYDGDGNRVSKTVTTATNTITTLYLVDDQNPTGYAQVLEELTSVSSSQPVLKKTYTYGHTLISQTFVPSTINQQPSTYFYGYDGHNNVRYLTDGNGFVKDTYDYDAYGNLISANGSTENYYLFTSEQYDLDLGLYYLRARYHNPDTGRFWNMDSYEGNGEDPATLHKYLYCHNNPVNSWDPSGHFSYAELGVSIAIGVVATIAVNAIASAVCSYQYHVAFTEMYSGGDLWHDTWTGALAGATGFGIGKGVGWVIGKYAPAAGRLMLAYVAKSTLLQDASVAVVRMWKNLDAAVVQGSQAAIESAEVALAQARKALTVLSEQVNSLGVRMGLRPAIQLTKPLGGAYRVIRNAHLDGEVHHMPAKDVRACFQNKKCNNLKPM